MNDRVCTPAHFLIKSKSMPCSMRRADIILIVVFLFTALLLGVFFAVYHGNGSTVRISCDGTECYRIALKDIDRTGQNNYYMISFPAKDNMRADDGTKVQITYYGNYPELPETGSYNLLAVSDGTVTMEAADCKDQICVHHRPIKSEGESIICLPHKLVVEMEGGEELLDGVAR